MLHTALHTLRHPLQALRVLLAALVGTLLAACGSGAGSRPATPPDEVERFGALELVTHFRAERGGDAARFAWQHVAHWSLRWQGQPLVIDTLGGMFGDKPQQLTRINAAFVVEHAGRVPDLVVNVGDPNNTSAFHLVRQRGDALQVRLLCIVSGGDNSVGWAQHVLHDGSVERLPAALPGRSERLHGPRRETLKAGTADGGRYLQLGQRCLFDTVTDQTRWLPHGGSALIAGPTMVSPEGTRLLRVGVAQTGDGANLSPQAQLQVAELLTLPDGVLPGSVAAHRAATAASAGRDPWQVVELQRTRHRYPALHAIDNAWVLHHFRWQRDAQGERLVERRGFAPLPHRGVFGDRGMEYKVEALRDGGPQRFVDFLVQRFDGRVVADSRDGFGVTLQVGEQRIAVHDSGFYVQTGKPGFPGEPGDPQVQLAFMRHLGEAFDAELASGRLDHLFTAAAPAAAR